MPAGRLTTELTPLFDQESYCEKVEQVKHYIHEGDIFQLVLANRLEAGFNGSLLDTYRILRTKNPSPYMFYFEVGIKARVVKAVCDLEIAGDTGKGGQADGVHLPSCRDKTQGKGRKGGSIAFLTAGENRNSAGIYDVFESGVPLRLRSVF